MSWWEFRGFGGILQRSRLISFSNSAQSVILRLPVGAYERQRATIPALNGTADFPYAQLQTHHDQPMGQGKSLPQTRRYDYLRPYRSFVGLGKLAATARRRNRRSNRLQPRGYARPRYPTIVRPAGLHLGNVYRHDSGHRRARSRRCRVGYGLCRQRVV